MSKKEVLESGMAAKLNGWLRVCRKFSKMELYGYHSETDSYEEGSIAQHFCIMLDCIEAIMKKTRKL